MRALTTLLVTLTCFLAARPVGAKVDHVYKYDQFSENIMTAATEISAAPVAVQSGFAKGEAFGQMYVPAEEHYPVEITGVDLFLAPPPNKKDAAAHASIEIWFHDGKDANPDKPQPDFVVRTRDLLDPISGQLGSPLKGGTAISIPFDWAQADTHPPVLTEGAFSVMVRFEDPATDMSDEWGILQCSQNEGLGMCGCQGVGAILDQVTTQKANVMHILSGTCSGTASTWTFANSIGVTGDFVLRVQAKVSTDACVPFCVNKKCGDDGCGGTCGDCGEGETCDAGQCAAPCHPMCNTVECGDDGCGGWCGDCEEGFTCDQGTCVASETEDAWTGAFDGRGDTEDSFLGAEDGSSEAVDGPSLLSVSPSSVTNDKDTPVSIIGENFADLTTLKLGATPLLNPTVDSPQLISATVPAAMDPGSYTLIAVFAGGKTATLEGAVEVVAVGKKGGGGGCTTGDGGSTAGALVLALLLLACAFLVRRRGIE